MDESVVAARIFAGEILRDVEILDLAGDTRGKRARVEARDRPDPRARRRRMFAQAARVPMPTGETMPIPVTTTRRLDMDVTGRVAGDPAVRALPRAAAQQPPSGCRAAAARGLGGRYFLRCEPT